LSFVGFFKIMVSTSCVANELKSQAVWHLRTRCPF